MAYAEHLLLRFGGSLGLDTWSCGIRLQGALGTPDTPQAGQLLADASKVVQDFYLDEGSWFSGLSTLQWVKLNAIGTDGRYASKEDTNLVEFTPQFTPPRQGSNAPPQLAVAITWRTAKKRGYAKSGRMYIPTAVTNVTGTGAMAQQPAEQMAAAGARFIAGLNGLGLLNAYRAAIFSKHAGEVNPITRVEVGTVIDTQQRRRRQIPEVYFGGDV